MFKTMTGVLNLKQKPTPEEIKKIPSFVFCRWLSGNAKTIISGNTLNQYYDIPIENQYHFIKSKHAGKINFIPYPKNIKEDHTKTIEYLSKHFKISEEKANDYLNYISDDELDNIVSIYEEYERNKK